MADEKKYSVGVTKAKYWQTIHDMLADDSTENHIPNRKVTIFEEKEWSSTRGTFMLTDEEAEELKKHGCRTEIYRGGGEVSPTNTV